MINNFISGQPTAKMYWKLFKTLLFTCNAVSLFIYSFLRFIFFEFSFESANELLILAKLFGVASAFAFILFMLVLLAHGTEVLLQRIESNRFRPYPKALTAMALLLVILVSSCKVPVSTGIKKDFNTGLTATYTRMEPAKVLLIMNDEELNHTDIPLGEKFLLVNDGIKGLEVKNGKVSVGCSLQITDSSGKTLLQEADLFAGHDLFNEKDAKMLKCTVSTGAPMKWEEKYNVKVNFWDKYGTGKIENTVTIRSIDMP